MPSERESSAWRFPKRKGFADTSGSQYEWKLAALLFLRLMTICQKEFFLATNMDGAGDFDDLILIYDLHGKITAYFLQLKHKKNSEYMISSTSLVQPTGVFSLPLLCSSFIKVEKELISKLEHDLTIKISDVEYILYTNAVVKTKSRGLSLDHILNSNGNVYSFDEDLDDDIFTSYKSLVEYKTLLLQLENLTCNSEENVEETMQQVNTLIESHTTNEFINRLGMLKSDTLNKDNMNRLLKEVKTVENIDSFRQFMRKFKIFHQQNSEWNFDDLILQEFKKIFIGITKESSHVFTDFMSKMENWWKTKEYYLTSDALLWKETIYSAVSTLSQNKLRELQNLEVNFKKSVLEPLSKILSIHELVTIVCNCTDTSLSTLKVHQALESSCHILVGADSFQKDCDNILSLWHSNRCPILVVQDEPSAQKFWKAGLQLIIITNSYKTPFKYGQYKTHILYDMCNLQQLDEKSQTYLFNKRLNFQGYSINIQTLVENDPYLANEISDDSLTCVIKSDGELKVGKSLPDVVNYYIPRTLHRNIHISKSLLQSEQTNNIFVISGSSESSIAKLLPPEEQICIYNESNYAKCISSEWQVVFAGDAARECFEKVCKTENCKDVHWLHVEDDSLKWIMSKGNVESLYRYIDKEKTNKFYDVSDIQDRIVLIVAGPGMGKSTLLTCLARTTKENSNTTWVVRINLNQNTRQFNTFPPSNSEYILQLLQSAAIDEELGTPFETMLFTYYLKKSGNIVVLVDGFDEICSSYTDHGLGVIHVIKETKVKQLWTTSRPVTRELLEEKLSCLSFSLYSFDKEDQKCFLKKFWGNTVFDKDRLDQFVTKTLVLLKNSLGLQGTKLMGIPLLTMLLAESFQNEVQIYCNFTDELDAQLPGGHLNITELYERFVHKKYEIAFKDKGETDESKASYKMNFKFLCDNYTKIHMALSLVFLLSPERLRDLNSPKIERKAKEWIEHEDDVEKPGIIIKISDGIPHFVHRTFADYFAALWLTQNFRKCQKFLEIILFDANFDVIRKMFDGILTKHCELHSAILNNNLPKLQHLLEHGAYVNETDSGGRTVLHLMVTHKELHHSVFFIKQFVHHNVRVDTQDLVLHWTPIQYAEREQAWGAVEALLELGADPTHLIYTKHQMQDTHYLKSMLALSAKSGYVQLLQFLIHNGANINMVVGNNHLTPIHFASITGHEETVNCLVQANADLNVSDIDGSTPLHLAAGWGHKNTVQCLVNAGANLNKSDIAGCTPLVVSDRWGHQDIVDYLVMAGANVKLLDCSPLTAAHQAAKDGDENTIRELIKNGYDVNSDIDGCTILHVAARWGHAGVVACLIQSGANINATDRNQSTPLYQAAGWDHEETVAILLQEGADVNLADIENSSPLHQAARWGHTRVIRCLLKYGAQPNKLDSDKYAAIHWAAMRGHANSVMCLVEGKADINIVDSGGANALHLVSAEGHVGIVRFLVQSGAHINLRDITGCTPLSLATRLGHINVERYLKSVGASI